MIIDFYNTDYFTHQVVHRAFTKVRNLPLIRKKLNLHNIDPSLHFFLNGFGLNCLVCVFDDRKKIHDNASLVLGRRSQRVARNAASGTWHVTANEALSKTDIEDQRISIDRWIRRALDEEVGIKESEIIKSFIFNVGIALTDMQPGMFCLSLCEIDKKNIINRITGSQDGLLEFDAYRMLPFDDNSINFALREGGLRDKESGYIIPFSPGVDNILRNIIARGTASFQI